jgi:hypothetical protein
VAEVIVVVGVVELALVAIAFVGAGGGVHPIVAPSTTSHAPSRGRRIMRAERTMLVHLVRAPPFLLASVVSGIGACVVGCGGRTGLVTPDPPFDASVDSVVDTFVPVDVAPPVEASPECDVIAERISARIVPAQGSCTTIVRISRDDVITGVHLFCGAYKSIDEASARKQSIADTGFGVVGCFASPSVTGATPKDDFVFFQAPSAAACACCGDGAFTAVSARNAMTVLGGAITFGPGKGLAFPAAFDPPSDFGLECVAPFPIIPSRGFDLTSEESPGSPAPPLDDATVQSRMKIVWHTALPAGIAKKHYLFDAVVLKYTPDATSTVNQEWIVMLNSGWLE